MSSVSLVFGPSDFINLPPLPKKGITFLALSIIAAGVIAAIYGVCGFTHLPHTYHLFSLLQHLSTIRLGIVISCGAITAGGGIFVYFLVHKKVSRENPEMTTLLKKLEQEMPTESVHFKRIKPFLRRGYKNNLEYYEFYYHLASISEKVESKEEWKTILEKLDGAKVLHVNSYSSIKIDCYWEFLRLQGKKFNFSIEELKKEQLTEEIKKDLNAICSEGFEGWDSSVLVNLFRENNRCFIIRENSSEYILGLINLEPIIINKKKILFVHTLARKANATKLGLTEKLKEYFLNHKSDFEAYETVCCEVLKENKSAQYIYKKIGFKKSETYFSKDPNAFVMEYQQ